MFVDASAICGVALREHDANDILSRLERATVKLTSPLAVWESVTAVARKDEVTPAQAHDIIMELLAATQVELVAISPEVAALAIEAFDRFGKGRHPAGLNFGDCFAYACARHFGMPLLYKGDDFGKTDIAAASSH